MSTWNPVWPQGHTIYCVRLPYEVVVDGEYQRHDPTGDFWTSHRMETLRFWIHALALQSALCWQNADDLIEMRTRALKRRKDINPVEVAELAKAGALRQRQLRGEIEAWYKAKGHDLRADLSQEEAVELCEHWARMNLERAIVLSEDGLLPPPPPVFRMMCQRQAGF